jgi:hypothetical protein
MPKGCKSDGKGAVRGKPKGSKMDVKGQLMGCKGAVKAM